MQTTSKSNIGVNVPRMVKEIREDDILKRVLLEGITNSIHAKATKIDCFIEVERMLPLTDKKTKKMIKGSVQKIVIKDNGVGFDDKNFESFRLYGTDYNTKEWGAKGTGRFCFLKLSDNVKYCSRQRDIILNINGEITELDKNNNTDETILELSNIKLKKKLSLDDFNKDIGIIYNKILPTLILVKENNYVSNLDIRFFYNGKQIKSISLNNIPKIDKDTFFIKTDEGDDIKFNLLYYIGNEINIKESGYCADFIKVQDFNFKINIPNSYIIFVQSNYLNNRVNESRTKLLIENSRIDFANPISLMTIDEKLKDCIQEILNNKFPEMQKENEKNFKKIVGKFPFFERDFNNIKTNNIGYLETKDYVQSSHEILDGIIDNLRKLQIKSLDATLTSNELQTIINNSSIELADYVVNRQVIIDQMQKLIDENTSCEPYIHQLIMKKRTELSKNSENYIYDLPDCNLWLIDDKFMTFSSALSDREIEDLKEKIVEYNNNKHNDGKLVDRPDLMLYFNSKNKDKLVVIELKPFSSRNKRNKINSISQLIDYAGIINDNFNNVKERWYYVITTIDDNFRKQLHNNEYQKLFSNGDIYFRYYTNMNIHLYVMDMQSLVNDANARNKVFMDILTQHFNQ